MTAPGRNLFKSLAEHGLSTPEICSLGYFLLIAGQETTTQLISTALFRLVEGSAPVAWKDAASEAGAGITSGTFSPRNHPSPPGAALQPRTRPCWRAGPGRRRDPPGTDRQPLTAPAGPERPAADCGGGRSQTGQPPTAWSSAQGSTVASGPSSRNSRPPSSSRKPRQRCPGSAAGPRPRMDPALVLPGAADGYGDASAQLTAPTVGLRVWERFVVSVWGHAHYSADRAAYALAWSRTAPT